MSWAEDMEYDIYDAEEFEIDEELALYRQELYNLSHDELLDKIVHYPYPNRLNNVVEDNHFPAYDIAKRIKENHWTMTPKQRRALINVYSFAIINEK